MNTKRTKSPKRWIPRKLSEDMMGMYVGEIKHQDYLIALGNLVVLWVYLEQRMIDVFRVLSGNSPEFPFDEVYNSIVNVQTKIKILRNILEKCNINQSKGLIYDEIIDEFYKLNVIRNQYIHGKWLTRDDDRVYLSYSSVDSFLIDKSREIKIDEIHKILHRMSNLGELIYDNITLPYLREGFE